MKVSSISEYYEEVVHQEHRTVLLNSTIQQDKVDNPSKTDYAGDLYPRDIIKILQQNQIKLYVLFDLFFHEKNCMRHFVFEKVVKMCYKQRPKKVTQLCEYYGVTCKPAPNKSAFVEVKAQVLQRRGRKFRAIKTIIYV